MLRFGVPGMLLLLLCLGRALAAPLAGDFVGAGKCLACHRQAAASWRGSHHQLAMAPAGEQTVKGDFGHAVFGQGAERTEFFRRGRAWIIRTAGPDGKPAEFPVRYVLGTYPLQQYLLALPGGRLQAFTVAWDARPVAAGGQRWYSLHEGGAPPPGDPLHWTGREYNWNFMCASCHTTDLRRNYDARSDTYKTRWSDDHVGCEACHGPGSRHLAWANGDRRAGDKGLSTDLRRRDALPWGFSAPEQRIAQPLVPVPPVSSRREPEICFPCHARRQEIAAGHRAGQPFLDSYSPSLLDDPLYEANGHIKDEVFEYGSFVQSRMYRAGVSCSNCHDAHSLKLKASGNALCLQCHKAEVFDTRQHHKHEENSPAAACVTCHMPSRTYMGVHVRHDHAFSIPRPDWTAKFGTGNACTENCHQGRKIDVGSNPGGPAETARIEAMSAWRDNSPTLFRRALTYLGLSGQAAITRATLLPALAAAESPATAQQALAIIQAASRDADGLPRLGAARSLQGLPDAAKVSLGQILLADPLRAVRIEAARALLGTIGGPLAEPLGAARQELIAAEGLSAERPEALVNLARIYRASGQVAGAEQVLGQAQRIAPDFYPALLTLADIRREQGREAAAEVLLRKAVAAAPDAADAQFALALGLVRQHRPAEAMPLLEKASWLAPENEIYAYTFGVAALETGNAERALEIAGNYLQAHPESVRLFKLRNSARKTLNQE